MTDARKTRTLLTRVSTKALSGLLALGLLGGCASGAKRSPEGLRDAYAAALRNNNPEAAYALLTEDVRARTDFETFRARWEANRDQHEAALEDLSNIDEARRTPVLTGTTAHEGGVILHWTYTSLGYMVVDGLPGVPDTSTPAATARALVAALRSVSDAQLERVLSTDMLERLGEDWNGRADAIESALEQPGSISYSADNARAVLRYGAGRAITFEQTSAGWRVAELR